MKYTFRVSKQMKTVDGLIKQQTRAKNPYVYLTLTTWDSKESLTRFRNTGAHLDAMKNLGKITDKRVKSVNWESDEFPDWKQAFQKIDEKFAAVSKD